MDLCSMWRDDDENDGYVSVEMGGKNVLGLHSNIYISAEICMVDGRRAEGYVCGNPPRAVAVIAGYSPDDVFVFNIYMKKEWGRLGAALTEKIGGNIVGLFPIKYTTKYFDEKGDRIEGQFGLDFVIASRMGKAR